MKKILLVLCMCIPWLGFAQEKTVLHGQIFFPTEAVSSINIINLHTSTGTYSDANGKFKIPVRIGDTLLFSSLQYKAYRLPIDKEILKKPWVAVHLDPGQTELESVLIQEDQLSGRMSVDAEQAKVKPYYDNESMGFRKALPLPKVEDRRIYTLMNSRSGIPLDGVFASISGQMKRARKQQAAANFSIFIEEAAHTFPLAFFVETCGVSEMYLYSFMHFCAKDEDFEQVIDSGNELEKIVYFKKKAKAYLKVRKQALEEF